MLSRLKTLALGGAADAATAVAVAAPTGVAHAAAYNGACGSGYNVTDIARLSNLGSVYLAYNSGAGNICVVTIRSNPGPLLPMGAEIRLPGELPISDSGDYAFQAGPVYASVPGGCLEWGGWIGDVNVLRLLCG